MMKVVENRYHQTTGCLFNYLKVLILVLELEECESSSVSRYIPIVVEILTRLVELRGINYQGIYRHAGGLTAVNWLVNELDKGCGKNRF